MPHEVERNAGDGEGPNQIHGISRRVPPHSGNGRNWFSASDRRDGPTTVGDLHDDAGDTRFLQWSLVTEADWRTAVLCTSIAALSWGAACGIGSVIHG